MALSSRTGRILRGIALGLAATLVVLALHVCGAFERLDLDLLDLQFQHLPTMRAGDDVVHVDIGDRELELLGRWPWPRRQLAQLVTTLQECGAREVLLDIILPEPQEPRFVKGHVTDLHLGERAALLTDDTPPIPVFDDSELAQAILNMPGLYLALHAELAEERPSQPAPGMDRVVAITATRPWLTAEEAALEVGPLRDLQITLTQAQRQWMRRRVRQLLQRDSGLSLQQAAAEVLGHDTSRNNLYDLLRREYLRQRGLGAVRRLALSPELRPAAAAAQDVVPPLVMLGEAARHTGFATIVSDPDGVVRRIPLLVEHDGAVYPQLALSLVMDRLAAAHGGCTPSAERDGLMLRCPDGFSRLLPLDAKRRMLINWATPDASGQIGTHIPASLAASVWECRQKMDVNRDRVRVACVEIARLLTPAQSDPASHPLRRLAMEHDQAWAALCQARRNAHAAALFDPGGQPADVAKLVQDEAQLEARLDEACRQQLAELDEVLAMSPPPATAPSTQPASAKAGDSWQDQLRQLLALRELARRAENEIKSSADDLKLAGERLRSQVAGKTCIVGSTATGAADFVPIPVQPRAAGVLVHANLYQTIVSGQVIRPAPKALVITLILLAGLAVSLITSTRGPVESAILTVLLIAFGAALSAGVWSKMSMNLASTSGPAVMVLGFATITVYRQLTEQRQRRQITGIFKQVAPPEVVDQLAEDPTLARLGGERRELTHLFSDLAGFTTLAEELGPQRTINLLNVYLDRVTEVVRNRYRGCISKYEGDAVYVFFGAPLPQADQAARSLAAALDYQAIMPALNAELRQMGLLPEHLHVAVRIGVATGEAQVGWMGSTEKKAYTCIGDNVNLAARLEGANKLLGTHILVNEAAWQAGGAGIIGRPIGRILVVGKTEPVAVFEPLARESEQAASDRAELRGFVADFSRGVERYAAGDFAAAREAFLAAQRGRPDDKATTLYLQLCEQTAAARPGDFDGVIRLTEK